MTEALPESAVSIQLSVPASILPASLVVLSLAFLFALLLRKKKQSRKKGQSDWSIPHLDRHADLDSFFHNWNPAVKVASLFLYCFLVVSLKTLVCSAAALMISILAVYFSKLPWRRSLQRLAAMSGFLIMFLLVLPFTSKEQPGEILLIFPLFPGFPFHLNGFLLALTIVVKACAIALLMEPMLGTSTFSATLQGFSRIGIPSPIIQMILLSHRYLFVFQQELVRMLRSMRVRGFTARTDILTMKTMGNFFGMLFINSYDRTQKVYEAMLCRGYRGDFPTFHTQEVNGKDLAKGGMWIMIGFILLLTELMPSLPSP
ncbi:MAG TPA: cobalt ECF transporter T component CbiQ [Desulfobacteraceae bacterium]|nr:cobalt ECF transporter T component CbiQ [Desulfobacteraceae bacterium]